MYICVVNSEDVELVQMVLPPQRSAKGAQYSEQGWEKTVEHKGNTEIRAGLGEDRGEQREHRAQNRVRRG